MKPVKRSRRIVIHTVPVKKDAKMLAASQRMLEWSERILRESSLFDTAVRDEVAEGLAYIVRSAYDTEALGLGIAADDFLRYIETKTEEWFRKQGFTEWFCKGAACLFSTSLRPYRFEGKRKAG